MVEYADSNYTGDLEIGSRSLGITSPLEELLLLGIINNSA